MGFQLSRPAPLMSPAAYKTYAMVSPIGSHFRPGTCAETQCPHYLNGWGVRVENLSPELLHDARTSGRKYQEQQIAEGVTYLVFEAGQPCFRVSEHRVRIDRPALYIVRPGDYRVDPRTVKARLHQNPEHWVEDFATHQQAIADEINKG